MFEAQTSVSFEGDSVLVNGRPTYAGTGVEGLLFNIRTVNATFDDTLNRMGWWDDDGSHPENGHAGYGPWRSPASAEANTERFIAALPEYRDWGVLAVNHFAGREFINSIHGSSSHDLIRRDLLDPAMMVSETIACHGFHVTE